MSAFSNLEYELFAPLSISYVLPQITRNLKKGESPDWWDERDSIGIEIARAENKHIGYSKIFSNKFLGKERAGIPAKELKSFQGCTMFDKSEILTAVSDFKGTVDRGRHIQLAIDKIRDKLELLNKAHFRLFETNCLYLYLTSSIITQEDITKLTTEYFNTASKFGEKFDHIFMWAIDSLIHYDVANKAIENYPLSNMQIAELNSQTHLLSAMSEWKVGTDLEIFKERLGATQEQL